MEKQWTAEKLQGKTFVDKDGKEWEFKFISKNKYIPFVFECDNGRINFFSNYEINEHFTIKQEPIKLDGFINIYKANSGGIHNSLCLAIKYIADDGTCIIDLSKVNQDAIVWRKE